jgi:hypothetical protein
MTVLWLEIERLAREAVRQEVVRGMQVCTEVIDA